MKKKYDLLNLVYCKEGKSKSNGAICVSVGNNYKRYYANGIKNHSRLKFSTYKYEID